VSRLLGFVVVPNRSSWKCVTGMIGTMAILIEIDDGASGGKVPVTHLRHFRDTPRAPAFQLSKIDRLHNSSHSRELYCEWAMRRRSEPSIHPGPSSGLTDPTWQE